MTQQTLKHWFKRVARYEDTGSLLFGGLVVFVLLWGVIKVSSFFVSFPQRTTSSPSTVPVELIEQAIQASSSAQPNVRKHTVQAGEGLWQIAEHYYQDGFQYLKIYEANKDQMKSPEDIRVGMELVIPE